MPFVQTDQYVGTAERYFGRYLASYRSEHSQVFAQLFERDGWVQAHVSFASGLAPAEVTDLYRSDLTHYASENGYAGRLRLLLS